MWVKIAWLAAAGAAGTLARYGVSGVAQRIGGASFPYGTMAVNLIGCFVVGVLFALFESRLAVSGGTRVIVMVGFMGAFTTFSSYILETEELLRSAEWLLAASNVLLQNGIGLAAAFAGIAVGRLV